MKEERYEKKPKKLQPHGRCKHKTTKRKRKAKKRKKKWEKKRNTP